MDPSRRRRMWTSNDLRNEMPLNDPSTKEEVPPQYEHYLQLLQERNRLMRRLRQKNKKEIDLEKKEKGFTLYLNSSYQEHKPSKSGKPHRAKTAGAADTRNKRPEATKLSNSSVGNLPLQARDKRRNWKIGSVEFTTADGQRQKIKAPEILSGRYHEDFEQVSSDDEATGVVRSMSSLDIDDEYNSGEDQGQNINSSVNSLNTPRKVSYLKRVAAAKREEVEIENRVTLKVEDVKKLRESLQMDKRIRQSIAMDADSDDSDGERVSPISEEIEEAVSSDDDRGKLDSSIKPLKLFKPGETLVLEFQPLPTKSKSKTNLSAPRKKDSDPVPLYPSKNEASKKPSTDFSSSKPSVLKTFEHSGVKKAFRPISANRKSSESKADSAAEANAVMKALQEENKKAELFSKVSSSSPLPQPKASATKSPSNPDVKVPSPVKSSAQPDQTRASGGVIGNQSKAAVDDADSINHAIERVLKMNSKQQKQLLQALNHIAIDETGCLDSSHAIQASWSSKCPETDRLEVTLEIKSNWGHPSLVGLTELQFFDQSGGLVPVKPSDVTVYGAGSKAKNVDVLFNGKSKTTKERNMWSCRFDGKPIEVSIMLINPNPGKTFQLGSAKVWNWNNKISNLDVGAKNIRIFFGGELLYCGDIDKGCGNQVFDYSNFITLTPGSAKNSDKSKVEPHSQPSKHGLKLNLNKPHASDKTGMSSPPQKNTVNSPAGGTKHSVTAKAPSTSTSPVRSAPHHQLPPSPSRGDISPALTPSGSHHTFRSISRSSQSSASSSGSARLSRGCSQEGRLSGGSKVRGNSREASRERLEGGVGRSETRTLNHSTVLLGRRGSTGSAGSGISSPEAGDGTGISELQKIPEKKRAQTPLKTKRVAARLNGRSSETENSAKSNADSFESKPPLPPTHKSEDKPVSSSTSMSRSVERTSGAAGNRPLPKPSPKSSKSEPQLASSHDHQSAAATSTTKTNTTNASVTKSSTSGAGTNAGVMNKTGDTSQTKAKSSSPANKTAESKEGLVEKIKSMGQTEDKRKKDIPKWLKDQTGKNKSGGREDEDLQKQLDEEFEQFSHAGSEIQSKTGKSIEEEGDVLTPMKKIERSRAKWRTKEEDLEESWGSLSFFNKSHRGRVSIDMGDDELDEYLNPSTKAPAGSCNTATGNTAPSSAPDAEPAQTSKLPIPEDGWSDEDIDDFTIPELPSGRELVINIKTTWGDHHYVGLTGVQLFTHLGEPVQVSKVWANPSDINILPEYNRDPRVVGNVLDGVNRTRDDVHMWLAPFTTGNNHFVYFTFSKPCKLALMRIWNYNKSRIHSFRGAKDVVITLDGTEIFKGEIARACGGIEGGTEAFGDTILFTTDEGILEAVSKNDDAFEGEMLSDDEDVPFERPSTADAEDDTRPFTRAAELLASAKNKETTQRPATSFVTNVGDVVVFKAQKLELQFTATWGDHHYLGLTGLELVGSEGEAIPLSLEMMAAQPRDLRHLPGNEKDDRTLDKLIDGNNVTCQDSHMWLIPYNEQESHTLTVTFQQQTLVSGVRIWNYNKSPEDTYRGAKVMHVQINNRQVSPPEGFLLRKGPGVCHFDFAQEVTFSNATKQQEMVSVTETSSGGGDQNYESVVQMPRGFIFQLQLFSTWGDQYYIGLNGLEFYDSSFKKIELSETNIAAYPDSVNVLDNVNNDARTPDKLIDGFNDTNDGRHMWLAPVLPSIINRVYVIFDQPTSISMIKLWNYSKTVNRGVKDFALLVDDLLVYNGTLQSIHEGAKGILPTCDASVPHHTILFSENKDILRREKNAIISNQTEDQDIQLLNDKQVVSKFSKSSSSKPVNQALRPKTSVTKTGRR